VIHLSVSDYVYSSFPLNALDCLVCSCVVHCASANQTWANAIAWEIWTVEPSVVLLRGEAILIALSEGGFAI
jgi:hypothetical protein